jgi:hypothetical protein
LCEVEYSRRYSVLPSQPPEYGAQLNVYTPASVPLGAKSSPPKLTGPAGVGFGVGACVGVGLGVGDCVGVALGETVADADGLPVTVELADGDGVGVAVASIVGEGVTT